MPQSVRNEQCNSTITNALNDSKTATATGVGGDTRRCRSFSYIMGQRPAQSQCGRSLRIREHVFPKSGFEHPLNDFLPSSPNPTRLKNHWLICVENQIAQMCLGLENNSRIKWKPSSECEFLMWLDLALLLFTSKHWIEACGTIWHLTSDQVKIFIITPGCFCNSCQIMIFLDFIDL